MAGGRDYGGALVDVEHYISTGSPSYLRPGTPALAWFLRDLDYTTGEFGKNHLGDLTIVRPAAAAPPRRPEQVEQIRRHRPLRAREGTLLPSVLQNLAIAVDDPVAR